MNIASSPSSDNSAQSVGHEKYLEFRLSDSYFAYPIARIREIMEYPDVEPIAGAPDHVKGAMNLRGQIIPVFDLALCIDKPYQPETPRTCVVITEARVNGKQYLLGNKVDMVSQVLDLEDSQLEPIPELPYSIESPLLKGIAKLNGRLLTILDIDKLLTQEYVQWVNTASVMTGKMDVRSGDE
ncbi:chemotaxis protein CheW [Vibrio mexicanus]|uniref:chemotaxis protein CheW n=1 Tax=Vibrio mexicanus TaxID=1004326 RepID=UPI00063CF279|nr:chemotaxis protein CheW [Vibrio mexicanus]